LTAGGSATPAYNPLDSARQSLLKTAKKNARRGGVGRKKKKALEGRKKTPNALLTRPDA